MPSKKLAGAAAFTAALAAGGAAGALFGTPVLSNAQEADSPATEPTPEPEARQEARPDGRRGEKLATAAEVLGMTEAELRTQLHSGKSIADVAAEKGVDKQKVIDALVAAASARIDQMKAQLPQRMAEMVERDGLPRHEGRHRGPGRSMVNPLDDAATALGISAQELRTELEAGKSIATIASEKGKSLDEVKAAMIRDAMARIDQAVTDGKLTAEQGAAWKADLSQKIDRIVEQEGLPMRGGRGHRGPGPGAPPASENTSAKA
jgi:polyhydroxyalkanoate synthesis regulator phasin